MDLHDLLVLSDLLDLLFSGGTFIVALLTYFKK